MSTKIHAELSRMGTFFPILSNLGNRWAASRPWEGRCMALHLHLTSLTAALVRELILGGGRWVLSAANPATTDPLVVEYLRDLGITVWSGRSIEDGIQESLKEGPSFFGDVGFALGAAAVRQGYAFQGGVEISRSGITKLRTLELPFPVVNIDGGRLKPAIESRHGVGEGLWQGFTALTGMHLAGRRVVVIGYGPVGAGVAAYARAGGAAVEVVEQDPLRRLIAHYDGFPLPLLEDALPHAQVLVTATGCPEALPMALLRRAPDGVVLINAGHHNNEIAVAALRAEAEAIDEMGNHTIRYRLGGRQLLVLGGGNPLNIVLNNGSREPVLLHFALLGLTLEWLSRQQLEPGEIQVPPEIEREAALAALQAHRIA